MKLPLGQQNSTGEGEDLCSRATTSPEDCEAPSGDAKSHTKKRWRNFLELLVLKIVNPKLLRCKIPHKKWWRIARGEGKLSFWSGNIWVHYLSSPAVGLKSGDGANLILWELFSTEVAHLPWKQKQNPIRSTQEIKTPWWDCCNLGSEVDHDLTSVFELTEFLKSLKSSFIKILMFQDLEDNNVFWW